MNSKLLTKFENHSPRTVKVCVRFYELGEFQKKMLKWHNQPNFLRFHPKKGGTEELPFQITREFFHLVYLLGEHF